MYKIGIRYFVDYDVRSGKNYAYAHLICKESDDGFDCNVFIDPNGTPFHVKRLNSRDWEGLEKEIEEQLAVVNEIIAARRSFRAELPSDRTVEI